MGLREAFWKINFCSRAMRLSKLLKYKKRPQIAIYYLEWSLRWKHLASGFNASLSLLSTSRRCSRNRSSSHLPVSAKCIFLQWVQVMPIDGISPGAREVIRNLIGSLGSRYFFSVVNERTSLASRASAIKSSRLVISLERTSDQKLAYVFVTFEWH